MIFFCLRNGSWLRFETNDERGEQAALKRFKIFESTFEIISGPFSRST